MELTPATAEIYAGWAYTQMLDVVDRLGDSLVNERPVGPETNTVAALIVHSCGVTEYWIGHVGLGRTSRRDRDSEFTATATVAELHALVERTQAQFNADVLALDAGQGSDEYRDGRQFLQDGDESDASLVVHVIEELFQHVGHMDVTADILLARE